MIGVPHRILDRLCPGLIGDCRALDEILPAEADPVVMKPCGG